MSDIVRKLATIREVAEIRPIEGADAIECAVVDGWTVVVQKGEYEPNDRTVFLEIDSWVPTELAPFLSKGKEPREYNGVKGERLRTIRLRGQLSQGLLLPISILPDDLQGSPTGSDLTEYLNIQKWEAPINAQLAGVVRGNFPPFIPKTDQERIQNCWKHVLMHMDEVFEVSQKLDGSSCTVYYTRHPEYGEDFGVCSRNMDLKEDPNNSFWKVALRYDLPNKLSHLGRSIAIQGELVGPGIQGNPEKLSDVDLFVFDVYDIPTGRYLSSEERLNITAYLGLKDVPILGYTKIESYGISTADLLEAAEGVSALNNGANKVREGLVFKSTESQFSFKVISTEYLLKTGG